MLYLFCCNYSSCLNKTRPFWNKLNCNYWKFNLKKMNCTENRKLYSIWVCSKEVLKKKQSFGFFFLSFCKVGEKKREKSLKKMSTTKKLKLEHEKCSFHCCECGFLFFFCTRASVFLSLLSNELLLKGAKKRQLLCARPSNTNLWGELI